MRRTSGRLRLCAALLVLNLAFIWGNSAMNADISNALSQWAGRLLRLLFPGGMDVPGISDGGHLLRKLAHLSEFACLGALLAWLFGMLGRKVPRITSLSLLSGISAACVDETIQIFSPGRSASLTDVLVDTAGVTVGIGLLLLGHTMVKKRKNKT